MKRQRSDAMDEYEAVKARSGSQFFATYGRMLAMRVADAERWKERCLHAEHVLRMIAEEDFHSVRTTKTCCKCTAWSILIRPDYPGTSSDEEEEYQNEYFGCTVLTKCTRCVNYFCNKHMPKDSSICEWCADVNTFLDDCKKKKK